ncbi:flagellar adenylate kinase [Ectocarpus siliculosus]|uniref:UMP-CMP kinase n=1 Tax=Ectocarpus siliculosus TaxID=2880 RepID=D8LRC1_ECTSI|nr:flagellar adenylate kinase [Ectocarpus siliculosus]|eukprot:CBN75026.1 flagellar adenylate kinase [Ectocarpus siliculosus]
MRCGKCWASSEQRRSQASSSWRSLENERAWFSLRFSQQKKSRGVSNGGSVGATPHVVFVLGGPGSGKGTQCALIAEEEALGYAHLSAGDLLRAERNSGSELAGMINEFIREGKIVPAEVTVGLLRKAMEKSGKSRFLIDGFPRNPDNLAAWEASTAGGAVVVDFALFLDCPEEIMTERIMERGRSSGRIDDNEEAIRKRLVTYRESTMPIIKEFEARGKLREVNSDQTIEEVAVEVRRHISAIA